MTRIKLYSNCIPVHGYTRSILVDLQYGEAHLIPNALYDILTNLDGVCDIDEILKDHSQADQETLTEYFNFLKAKKLVFQADDFTLFPPLNLEYRHYSLITNATIDIDNNSNFNIIDDIVKQLNEIGCEAIQLRFFGNFNENAINRVLRCFETTRIKHIELQIEEYTDSIDLTKITSNNRIRKVIINNSPEKRLEIKRNIYIEFRPTSLTCQCSINSVVDMNFNNEFFIEAKQYNSCLNRKIAIKRDGSISNCPYSCENFGSIVSSRLKDIIVQSNFQKYWNINKDIVDVCNVCEFRYCCTDCRVQTASITNDNLRLSPRPTNCAYNPYIGKWSHENGYIPVNE